MSCGLCLTATAFIGSSNLRWVTKTRLLGMTVDHKLTLEPHVPDTKKSFVTRLDLLKRSRFLPTKDLGDFHLKEISPSVEYGLVLWGACCDSDLVHSIEWLHCRASRIIFNLPKEMVSCYALGYDLWPSFFLYYKLDIFKLFHKAHNDGLP